MPYDGQVQRDDVELMPSLPKREFKFVVPARDNKAQPLGEVHEVIQKQLLSVFGGYSMYPIKGQWLDENGKTVDDVSLTYVVAVTKEQEHILKHMIRLFGIAAKQDAIYGVDGAGYVDIQDLMAWRDENNLAEMLSQRLAERDYANRPWNA